MKQGCWCRRTRSRASLTRNSTRFARAFGGSNPQARPRNGSRNALVGRLLVCALSSFWSSKGTDGGKASGMASCCVRAGVGVSECMFAKGVSTGQDSLLSDACIYFVSTQGIIMDRQFRLPLAFRSEESTLYHTELNVDAPDWWQASMMTVTFGQKQFSCDFSIV